MAGGVVVGLPSVNSYAVEVFDVRGRLLAEQRALGCRVFLDCRELARGIYFVRVAREGTAVVKACVWDGRR
jgi:hypothetical protein